MKVRDERAEHVVLVAPAPSHCSLTAHSEPVTPQPAWPENMQICTPAILYVIIMYVFRTIVLAAVVGRPAYQFIDTVYVRD